MVQAPAAEEPDASAFSQMLTPAAAAQHDGTSAPEEPGAVWKEGDGLVGNSEHGPGGEPARHTSTADVLDYRERLTGCAGPFGSTCRTDEQKESCDAGRKPLNERELWASS